VNPTDESNGPSRCVEDVILHHLAFVFLLLPGGFKIIFAAFCSPIWDDDHNDVLSDKLKPPSEKATFGYVHIMTLAEKLRSPKFTP